MGRELDGLEATPSLIFGESIVIGISDAADGDPLNGTAYEYDSQIKQVTVALAYDKQAPRIEMAVEPN